MNLTVAYNTELRDRVLQQLVQFGEVHGRAMFGGYGLFERGAIFGLINGDTLYFKVDDASKPQYVDAGSRPFNPYGDPEDTLFYYSVPDDLFADGERLLHWWKEAVRVGHRTRRRRASSSRRRAR